MNDAPFSGNSPKGLNGFDGFILPSSFCRLRSFTSSTSTSILIELITTSLEFDPSNSYGYKNRALVYIKLGQKDSALIDLRKAKLLGYQEDYDNEVDDMLEMEFNL